MVGRLTPLGGVTLNIPPVRAVLFDAVGTVLHAQPTVGAAYAAAGGRFGVELSEAEARRRFLAAFRRDGDDSPAPTTTSPAMERRRWRQIVRDVFPELVDTEALFEMLWDHFALPAHWQLDPEFGPLARALGQRGIVVGLASNFDERLHTICAGYPPLAQLERVFVSSELGQRKPGVGFFRAIEQALGLAAAEILLVGDDPVHDYHAARQSGWHAVLVDRTHQHAELASIAALGELLPRLSWLGP